MQSYWKRFSNSSIKILSAVSMLFVVSCAKKTVVTYQPIEPKPPEIQERAEKPPPGSLFTGDNNLFSDDKAHSVGDIITIKVIENISGSGSADTKSSRNTNLGLDFPSPTIMGKQVPAKTPIASVNAGSSNQFKGQGNTSRKAKLIATISARVVKVYPNGNLFIVGKKKIKINEDLQVITISGIVKPTYIQQDNSVLSSQISDMQVEYNGQGFMADNQEPGWLAKILTKIWPF